jgi:isocitrate dehydrogenase
MKSKIIYTHTDEAPALATYSLLPIVNAFTKTADIKLNTCDISLSGRVISQFPELLTKAQQQSDDLAYLGELVEKPEANIIKLPNISASIPQLKATIAELQSKGYPIPDYPEEPKTEEEKVLQARFAKALGSAVNPVLRQGNSDRRVAPSVKAYAQMHPKRLGEWSADSKSEVVWMNDADFYENEKSVTMTKEDTVGIEFVSENGLIKTLKSNLKLLEGEVIDATFMSIKELRTFIEKELQDAKEKGQLFSVHLKATMMKVSDPIIFGHFVTVYFKDVFEKHAKTLEELGVNPDLGLGDLYKKMEKLPDNKRAEIEADIEAVYSKRPDLAMVNSDKGITNLHFSNDIIIDASMPNVVRDSGKMWGPDGQLHDTKAVIPDRCYSRWYQIAIDFCKKNGAFDPATMGNVANVGLMAQKAEEYGSHDKTFIAPSNGKFIIKDSGGNILTEHLVEEGDIWRASQTKDLPIKDWVALGLSRARSTGNPAVFWLDQDRAHDAELIKKVHLYLKDHETNELDIKILSPVEAMKYTLERSAKGLDTISVTGNVLRDYITDLFPILELGTSAKMLSIVPLLNNGSLFETGAGGSAPKHVEQFVREGHLRWDSLGEFLALTVSLEDLANKTSNPKALLLAKALDQAVSEVLNNGKSPSRKVGELDNRGSHFYLAMYWAQALARQSEDKELATKFSPLAEKLRNDEQKIVDELNKAQGVKVDIGGYFKPDSNKCEAAMRPSPTLNKLINNFGHKPMKIEKICVNLGLKKYFGHNLYDVDLGI